MCWKRYSGRPFGSETQATARSYPSTAPEGGMLGISDSELEAHKRLLGCLRPPEVRPPICSNS